MSEKPLECSAAAEKKSIETEIAGGSAGGSSEDTGRSENTEPFHGIGGKCTGARPRRSTKVFGPSKPANEKKSSKGKKSVGTQVDVRVWVTEKDLKNEQSKEIYWRKMAETSQAVVTELQDDNKKLHVTIDYLSRENVRYQQIIDQHLQYFGACEVTLPELPTVFDQGEEEIEEAAGSSKNSCGAFQ